jgi:hypothetical protein
MSFARDLLNRHVARRNRTRGQALVEMAIILPLLAVFLVMAIDAGRMFFGWVALQNASRIGADYVASHADSWTPPITVLKQRDQDRYKLLVAQDLQALGCQAGFVVPPPDFDPDGDGTDDFSDGAPVRVELECPFPLLTPLASIFLGDPFTMHARSDFAINRTYVGGLPVLNPTPPPPGGGPTPSPTATPFPTPTPTPGTCVAPDFDGPTQVRRNQAQAMWTAAGFTTPLVFQGNGNFVIQGQAPLEGNQSGPCNTVETVANVPI